jgi:hypothetical protein
LRARTAQLVKELMPGVRGMLGGYQKQEFVLKAGQVKQAQALLDDIGRQGSPALRAAIAEVQPQVAGSAGLTLRQAWEAAAR